MSTWIIQHFLNPAFVVTGLALVAVPIIIHLINRMRFRTVRFAAMEFLLASEQKNRRRILIEQLLLLFLRILIVLLLVALIGRLVLDASQMSMFQGAKSHHVVLLDDSGSMRDRLGETTAFEEGEAVIRRLVAEGSSRPGTQLFTLMLLSRPHETLAGLSERDIDESLVSEVTTRLGDLESTHQQLDLAGGLEAARARFADDSSSVKHLHVVSDFRRRDWFDNKAVGESIRLLDEAGVGVNLVRTLDTAHENLAVSDLSGSVEVAAAGVPVSLSATVTNLGVSVATEVRLSVFVDGRQIPMNEVFRTIEPGQDAQRTFEVVFDTPGIHRVHVALDSDALEADNTRYLAIDVPTENPILIVDGTPGTEQGLYVADALAADKSVTGFGVIVDSPEYLRRHPLDGFHAIFAINVAQLPPDGLAALEEYVAGGGGLAWFMGDTVQPAFYNDKLYAEGAGLFPVRLAAAPRNLPRSDATMPGPDVIASGHPVFRILGGADNPFIDAVFINRYFPIDPAWRAAEPGLPAEVTPMAELRNRAPLMLEHRYVQGRIVTSLTAAGPAVAPDGTTWNNWANGPGAPSFAVLQLEIARLIARRDRTLPQQIVGEPIEERFSRVLYRDELEIITPDNQATQITATTEDDPADGASPAGANAELQPLVATFRDTDTPGLYAVRRMTQEQNTEEKLIAYNVPSEEGRLAVADDAEIRREIGEDVEVTIQAPGQWEWIRSESLGQEIRWWLLFGLLAIGMCEQAMAYRLSYHPRH